jgi:hypothetical protein
VRLELRAAGRPANEPLEVEISRERYALERFGSGETVNLRLRRWQLYPTQPGDVAPVTEG